ncbi:alpha-2-macroglobulin family protein [Leptospira inadai serovar Lyme str. 10]|uniref:Alpha-2-macroglobulin family protein n=2 Tax=Leptospira inadai serovar Lyme TaxID=293084 RepID=V6HW57_9LEPT|nr:Ig-like domain-containing alpha-2-macroglobulin family protein [Leptospira inadai]EQA37149.1 alpha-2-macroglobulin family protein [Leptospira inadai serovar Lyme str. 10]PNV76640.1 peptidase inhibitor [Leptospira inadai serovar Lyme]
MKFSPFSIRVIFLRFPFFLFFISSGFGIAQSAKVQFSFSPQGEIKKVGQVQALFREPMVPLGDPKRAVSPFKIDCPIKGEERWVTETDWVYEFDQPLPGGLVCKFTTSSLKSIAGNVLDEGKSFTFSTGGPGVSDLRPYQGSTIAEDQAFVLQLDAEPKPSDVTERIYFAVEGLGNRIPIRIIQGKDREAILNASGTYGATNSTLVIGAKQVFPSGKSVRIVVERGLRSTSGVATSSNWETSYRVRPSFTAGFTCERVNAKAGCVPISPVYATFSSPIRSAWKNQIYLKTSDGKSIPVKKDDSDNGSEIYSVAFSYPLPANTEFQLVLPKGITDDAGRSLENASSFPLTFRTDEYPPLAKFAGEFGIIERFPEALLPVTIRNIEAPVQAKHLNPLEPNGGGELILEQWATLKNQGKEFLGNAFGGKNSEEKKGDGKTLPAKSIVVGSDQVQEILYWLRRIPYFRKDESIFKNAKGGSSSKGFGIPSAGGEKRFEVVGIPLKRNGLHIVEIESAVLGRALDPDQKPMFVRTAALVTNLSLHFKWGRENSLVWLTSLDKGAPIDGADVFVYDCGANLIWKGVTGKDGSILTKDISRESRNCRDVNRYSDGYFLVAKRGEDFTFLHTTWDDGIEPWRFQLRQNYYDGNYRYATVLDRSLFREGETVRMNHILRLTTSEGFRYPNRSEIPNAVQITHNATGQDYPLPVNWSESFSAETQFTIPKESVLGEYSIYFLLPGGRKVFSGSFTSAQFRLPLLKGELQADSSQLIAPKDVSVTGQISYLSGGKAGLLPVSLRSSIKPSGGIQFPLYPNVEFGNGKSESSQFQYEAYEEDSDSGSKKKQEYQLVSSKTDANGFLSEKITIPRKLDRVHSLDLEMEWKDPNGEIQTVARNFRLLPSKNLVAIRNEDWVAVRNKIRSKVFVLDPQGNPVPGKNITVKGISAKYISHRRRLVGGFYSYNHRLERKDIGQVCSGTTNEKGILDCQGAINQTGELYLEAKIDGEESYAHTSIWVLGEKELWFGSSDNDRMDLFPERKKYEPGEIARFQVRMPFKTATALITVEREGVLRSFVQTLSGTDPSVEIPIESNYGPNVFVSVLAVRGRVEAPKPTALIDLAKPAYRLGMTEIQVGWRPYELDLKVLPEKEEYHPREKAKVKILLSEANREYWKNSKITLAAVDESLLELKPNLSWNLLNTMMSPRGIDVTTSTAQTFIIGRRHFGLKSLPAGGGGGKSTTRELFDTLLYWKADAIPNSRGEIEVEIPLNDSLTSFRIVAVANSGTNRFGTASANIRTRQEILSYASASPFVREGDRIRPGISLKNTTAKSIQVQLRVKSNPDLNLASKSVVLAPSASETVFWETEVPKGVKEIVYDFSTEASSISFTDTLRFKQTVGTAIPLQVLQANFYQLTPSIQVPVEEPTNAEPNRGTLEVTFNSSLVAGPIAGIESYMEKYPYSCLEQKLSKAVSLGDETNWKEIVRSLPKYLDPEGLLQFFPNSYGRGSVPLTVYTLLLSSESGWEIPESSRQAMIGALNRFIDGTLFRSSPLATSDTLLRKIGAMEAVSRFGAVEASRIRSIETDPNRLPTETLVSLRNLYRNANWDSAKRNKIDEVLRSRLRIQGSSYELASDESQLWWLLSSRDAAQIRLLNSILKDDTWKEDVPKLLRGTLNQIKLGHFDITTANAFAILALKKYRSSFESSQVKGTAKASFASGEAAFDWKSQDGRVEFSLPKGKSNLKLSHEGSGSPYAYVKTSSAIPLSSPLSSGLRIQKEILDESGKPKSSFKEGDIVRVRLKLRSEFSISWLALRDPIPAGATILGSGLSRDSAMLTSNTATNWWDGPSFVERKFEGITAYYELFYPGEATYEYVYRINSPGVFTLPPTRAEAMYQPEIFAANPNITMPVDNP